jgi:hypothetical protein
MNHYFTVPVNTDGIVADLNAAQNFKNALNTPFVVNDVFVFSHGWWTSATRALSNYNQFTIEFATHLARIAGQQDPRLTRLPGSVLSVGIHWPSMIDDDDQAVINAIEPLSFYTMAHRANQVGKNAVYALIRLIVEQSPVAPRLHFLGHSFGCRVVCAAIQEILDDRSTIPQGPDLAINAVLLEPAFDSNDLEAGEVYGGLGSMPNLRMLTTFSGQDRALTRDYPLSQNINIFKGPGGSNDALGGVGPTPLTVAAFGSVSDRLAVGPGFSHADSAVAGKKLVVADLTPLHAANTAYPKPDHHSDIFLPEIYEMICGFLFR